MKRFLFLFILTGIAYITNAKVITLCNEEGISADYNNFEDAQTNANSGDTIYIYPSKNSYGNLTISKTISLLGPGNQNPKKAIADNITIDELAEGTQIIGMTVSNINCSALYTTIAKNKISELNIGTNANNCIIRQNVFDQKKSSELFIYSIFCEASIVHIFNNYISAIVCHDNTQAKIKNNLIQGFTDEKDGSNTFFIIACNSTIHNNNYYGQYGSSWGGFRTPTFIKGVNNDESNNYNRESATILFEGSYPFTKQPSVPTISNVNIPDVVNQDGNLEISFEIIINN